MTAADFQDWKRHPVTQAVFNTLELRMSGLVEEIVEQTATSTSAHMAEKTGAIKAFRDVLQVTFEETQHGN